MPTDLFERVAGPEGSEQEAEIESEVRAALGETVGLEWGSGEDRASFGVRWPEPKPAPVPGIAPAPIEVVLRNGRVLRVTATTDAAVVARLAAALEA